MYTLRETRIPGYAPASAIARTIVQKLGPAFGHIPRGFLQPWGNENIPSRHPSQAYPGIVSVENSLWASFSTEDFFSGDTFKIRDEKKNSKGKILERSEIDLEAIPYKEVHAYLDSVAKATADMATQNATNDNELNIIMLNLFDEKRYVLSNLSRSAA